MRVLLVSSVLALAGTASASPVDVLTSGIDGIRLWRADGRGGFVAAGRAVSDMRHHAAIAVGDLNGDGCEDLFAVRFERDAPHTVMFGCGHEGFVRSRQRFGGDAASWGAALADLDGDRDLDAYVSTTVGTICPADEVWLNDGKGTFEPGESVGNECSAAAALADFDGDGDVDVAVANTSMNGERPDGPGYSKIWINDGKARFSARSRGFGPFLAHDVVSGDLDGDGDFDVVIAAAPAMRILRNVGGGRFDLLPQELGDGLWFGVAVADVDGDRDLDIVGATADRRGGRVWFNGGNANFQDSGQALGRRNSLDVELHDVDGDGDADAVFANRTPDSEADAADAAGGANEIWLNDGRGKFTQAARGLGTGLTRDIALLPRTSRKPADGSGERDVADD